MLVRKTFKCQFPGASSRLIRTQLFFSMMEGRDMTPFVCESIVCSKQCQRTFLHLLLNCPNLIILNNLIYTGIRRVAAEGHFG